MHLEHGTMAVTLNDDVLLEGVTLPSLVDRNFIENPSDDPDTNVVRERVETSIQRRKKKQQKKEKRKTKLEGDYRGWLQETKIHI